MDTETGVQQMSVAVASGGCTSAADATTKIEASLPVGFQDQLNQVVRAVLLGQPAYIYRFIADFLDAQLDERTQQELRDHQPQPTSEVSIIS